MDIKQILEMASEMRKSGASNLTIGEMQSKLEQFNNEDQVTFLNGKYFDGDFDSYRGYYVDMYLGYSDEDQGKNTVEDLKQALESALKQGVMEGYKGGTYSIDHDTLLWLSSYGCCGDMIVDVVEYKGDIVIVTKEDEY